MTYNINWDMLSDESWIKEDTWRNKWPTIRSAHSVLETFINGVGFVRVPSGSTAVFVDDDGRAEIIKALNFIMEAAYRDNSGY